jgi:hypothetical protein
MLKGFKMYNKNKNYFLIIILLIAACSVSYGQAAVKLTPLEKPKGEFGNIGFKITAAWMDGSIEMRFPETLDCQEGMFFIDHYRADMVPFSKVKEYPDWKVNSTSGEISYSFVTAEGLKFGGIAIPVGDEVRMEFYVINNTGKRIIDMSPQICLMLNGSKDFDELNNLSDGYILSGGKWMSLEKSTPTAAEKGLEPKLVIGKSGFMNMQAVGKTKINKPGENIGEWWMINEPSDEDIIYRASKDKKHLAAVAWPGDVSFLIYNSMNPCIHAGPSIQYTIEPGRERHWYGTVYLMDNKPGELLQRYKNGRRAN